MARNNNIAIATTPDDETPSIQTTPCPRYEIAAKYGFTFGEFLTMEAEIAGFNPRASQGEPKTRAVGDFDARDLFS
jgi:hypothetical protein